MHVATLHASPALKIDVL